jgi:uncharacterized protein (DUF1015 family)
LKDLNSWAPEQLLEILGKVFTLNARGAAVPGREHELGLYLAGRWLTLAFQSHVLGERDASQLLDVALLQKQVLEPVFGINDPRTSQRIHFVGGIRGTAELEKLVDSGEFACAFSMFPLRIETLMSISDAGGVLPPKSTWFEPKLRDGMFSHLI